MVVSMHECSAAVLAGGASRRMGTDKAVVTVGGVAMSRRVADAARRAGIVDVVQIGGAAGELEVIADRWPGAGPLGGVITALAWSPTPWVLVIACDLPHLDASTIGSLLGPAGPGVDVVVGVTDRREPLCALWCVDRALEQLADAFAGGERAVHAVLGGLAVAEVAVDGRAVQNVNSPDDLAMARRSAGRAILAAQDGTGSRSVAPMTIVEITVEELADRLGEGAVLFDVRELDEYAEGHAPGAILIPLSELPDRVAEFPTEGQVLVICKSGGRSMRACEFLADRGVQAVNVAGGTGGWIRAGFEVVTGTDPA